MDIQLIDERIAALVQAKNDCQCDDQQAEYLRLVSNALIQTYRDLRQQIIDSAVDATTHQCNCRSNNQ